MSSMNKRHVHHFWTKFRLIKPRYFLILALVSGLVCVVALRGNNKHMASLRSDVYSADKSGEGVDAALKDLQSYVTSHMNTNLASGNTSVYPPIQLQYTYDRLVTAQGKKLQQANATLYTAAQHHCEALDPVDFSGHNRVPCIEAYVSSHGEKPLAAIPAALYEFNFISPRWSPDLAGWTLLITIVSTALTVITFFADRWFKTTI
jgi:hypothetical protein